MGVLFAAAGFLVFFGPALISGVFWRSLHELPFDQSAMTIGEAAEEMWLVWWFYLILYYVVVLAGAAFLVWSRRNTSVILRNISKRGYSVCALSLTG